MMNQPLKGIKVIDFSAYGAGPAAGKMLADWGADVIKIEPLKGDPSRSTSKTLGMRADDGENQHMELKDANKRSLPLNMKTAAGKEIMDKLLDKANIFISNYRIKALQGMGLDYETVSKKHPHIIWGILTGFGLEGAMVNNPGFDTVAFYAKTGQMIDFCENGEFPLTPPFGLGDMGTACSLAGGVAACLYRQAKTGEGEKVIVSLYGQGLWDESALVQSVYHGDIWPKTRKKPDSPLRNTFKCKDGVWMMISVIVYDRYFPVFCKVVGREDLINDKRFNTETAVKANAETLMKILDPIFLSKDFAEWDRILNEADIAHDRINHIKDILNDKQAWDNGFLYKYKNRDGVEDLTVSTPVKFGTSEPPEHRNAPLLGEHTVEVLIELGYDRKAIGELAASGVTKML
ncbi:CaiB/BaiF CoA transferase family protein [Sporolactobacillus sp. KGMB 08714]|uniref:CaiB/BaiF CoA transferase family protein n=1 Tax=Sporolactobacillus sp. KGMB 08714 TaxID=3064704 RepID=UPI002FBDE125